MASGDLLMTAEHVKFMPSGAAWDIVHHPRLEGVLQPLGLAVLSFLKPTAAPLPAPADLTSLFEFADETADAAAGTASATVAVTSAHCNPLGFMHGGAACFLSEVFGRRAAAAMGRALPDSQPPVSVRTTFLAAAPANKPISVTATNSVRGGALVTNVEMATLPSKRGPGKTTFQAELVWG